MKLFLRILVCCIFLSSANALEANHLVGGELSYVCLGGNQYEITMTIYRDCIALNAADFDDPANVWIVDSNGDLVQQLEMGHNPDEDIEIPVNTEGICDQTSPDLCVEFFTYSEIITLPEDPGGYTLIHQRCCRNNSITNITNPGGTGSTYELAMPGNDADDPCSNSSPQFNNLPPLVVCQGAPFEFDYSGSDADGDQLVYEICDIFDGASEILPEIGVFGDLAPYGPIDWAMGYDAVNQLGMNSTLTIDSATGLLTMNPSDLGKFVVGVCISEFRDGVLLSRKVRDYQFTVVPCEVALADAGDDQALCGAQTVMLSGSAVGNNLSYSWTPADLLDDPTILNPTVTGLTETTVFTLSIDNGAGCSDTDSVTISLAGTSDSDPGVMTAGPLFACDGASVSASSSGSALSGDAVLAYYLHTADGNVLGEILDMNFSGSFSLPANATSNTMYYISAIVGDPGPDGFPDLNGGCIAVAPGTPVVFLDPVSIMVDEYCDPNVGEFFITIVGQGGLPAYNQTSSYSISGEGAFTIGYGESAEIGLGSFDGMIYNLSAEDELGCSGQLVSDQIECIKELAIYLDRFTAVRTETSALVEWTTAAEIDNDYFQVERSRNGDDFEVVGVVNGALNSTQLLDYKFVDEGLGKLAAFYRLGSVDINGNLSYSQVVYIHDANVAVNETIVVGPNPFDDFITINSGANFEVAVQWQLRIYNADGKLLRNELVPENQSIFLGDLPAGLYFLDCQKGLDKLTQRIVKQ